LDVQAYDERRKIALDLGQAQVVRKISIAEESILELSFLKFLNSSQFECNKWKECCMSDIRQWKFEDNVIRLGTNFCSYTIPNSLGANLFTEEAAAAARMRFTCASLCSCDRMLSAEMIL
jgi:hypothetical protein